MKEEYKSVIQARAMLGQQISHTILLQVFHPSSIVVFSTIWRSGLPTFPGQRFPMGERSYECSGQSLPCRQSVQLQTSFYRDILSCCKQDQFLTQGP
ncbi:hypothetical protein TNCV_1460311 [Trichonephila clavipes]|nr:hypothetical protein TNCV_1460311 [Trichonephila clavipes]